MKHRHASAALVSLAIALALAWGCGGAIVEDTPLVGRDAGRDGAVDGRADAKADAKPDAMSMVDAAKPDAGKDALPEYVDPGCGTIPPPVEQYECDPYGPASQCDPGKACYPFVQYPSGPCEPETYGAVCYPFGTGVQGDPCYDGCQAGHVCVISGQGTQCVQMCDLGAANPCPDGLVCGAVDVPGIGGCI